MAGAGGPPPLRLKDLLELDCDSCSAAGFRCYPRRLAESAPMRHLLESSPSLRRRRRPGKLSHLSRSLSRRLSRGGGFWRRRDVDDEEEEEEVADAATTTTGVPACCGSSSEEQETSSESSDNSSERTSRRSRSESDSDFSSATEESAHHHPPQAAAAGDEVHEVAMKSASKEGSSSGSEAGDKEQQLSPVGVMDFPFDDDEEDESRDAGVACSPSFSLARLQRRKTHKIRRLGSGGDYELAPLDLEALLATTQDSDPDPDPDRPADEQTIQCRTGGAAAATPTCASRGHGHGHRRVASVFGVPDEDDNDLVSLLTRTVSAGLDGMSERLLLDFFVEVTKRRRSEAHAEPSNKLPGPAAGLLRREAERLLVDGEAVAAARGWLEGTANGRWGLKDVLSGGGADIVAEMGRGRRWMQVGEEEREVVALVTGMLVDQLVADVVRCLAV